jgi:tetratricopeptide (TPR) repeat protein
LKKFFKYLFIGLGTIILLIILGITIWWNIKSDTEKSDFFFSIGNYKKAIDYNPDNNYAWMELSVSYNKAGDFKKGFKYLNKAVDLSPSSHLGYRGWIRLRKIRDYDKALIDFNRLDSLTPNFIDYPWSENINFLRGECHYGNKKYKKAIECFNTNIKEQKEGWADVHSFVYLGLCEYELGNYEKSISEFKRAIEHSKYVPEASFGISKAYYKLGNIEKAKESILEAEITFDYKREDIYNEFLNEVYLSEIREFKEQLDK